MLSVSCRFYHYAKYINKCYAELFSRIFYFTVNYLPMLSDALILVFLAEDVSVRLHLPSHCGVRQHAVFL